MALIDLSTLAQDQDFRQRVAACAANAKVAGFPLLWADNHQWEVAAAPGFADAYASAVAAGRQRPGRDPDVITDAQIVAAVTAILAAA